MTFFAVFAMMSLSRPAAAGERLVMALSKDAAKAVANSITEDQVSILANLNKAGVKGICPVSAGFNGRALGGLKRRGLVEELAGRKVRITDNGKVVAKSAA